MKIFRDENRIHFAERYAASDYGDSYETGVFEI